MKYTEGMDDSTKVRRALIGRRLAEGGHSLDDRGGHCAAHAGGDDLAERIAMLKVTPPCEAGHRAFG